MEWRLFFMLNPVSFAKVNHKSKIFHIVDRSVTWAARSLTNYHQGVKRD